MSAFITFEGGDGSGKSTQARLLYEFLLAQEFDVMMTHEPGGTEYGEMFRHLLLDMKSKESDIDPRAQVLGFCSARAQLVAEQITPRLKKQNSVVISDRYSDSTIAYQVFGGEMNDFIDAVEGILQFATHGLKPDLTIFLDILPSEGRKRTEGRIKKEEEPHDFRVEQQLSFLDYNHYDQKELKFHEAVREGYMYLINKDPERWWIIDGSDSIDAIQEEIQSRVLTWLKNKEISPKSKSKHQIKPAAPEEQDLLPLISPDITK